MRPMQPRYIANFDSAAAMLRSLAYFLKGYDFPMLGVMPKASGPGMKAIGSLINRIPQRIREQIYIWNGWAESIAPRKLHKADAERVAKWMMSLYPTRKYPAIAVGSSNGAAVHLWTALGIPWLPQTFLLPVARSGVHPDEPKQDARWAEEPARAFLESNPHVQLHHMHDPNQDRLMVQRMTYFRVKRLRLGKAYEEFIRSCLEPGGTILIVDCTLRWPTTKMNDRCIFQFGAHGGAEAKEYHEGGTRVEDYLTRYGSYRNKWDPPTPDGSRPEAEWGFESALADDIERFAERHGYQIRRIIFEEPEQMSPLIADLYQWWNTKRGILGSRLLVESFIVMEPYWTVRTGSIPFWMVFNKEPSFKALNTYLDGASPIDEIYMMLFSHGVESIGLVPIVKWREILDRSRRHGAFVGVDEKTYPRDFAVFVRYYFDLLRRIKSRYPMPPPLGMEELDEFLAENEGRYRVQWNGWEM